MDNSRALPSADAREILTIGKQGVYKGVLLVTSAGMHDEPGGLVEHEEVVILEQNIKGYPLGLRFNFFSRWFGQLDDVPSAHKIARARRFSVQGDKFTPNQRL